MFNTAHFNAIDVSQKTNRSLNVLLTATKKIYFAKRLLRFKKEKTIYNFNCEIKKKTFLLLLYGKEGKIVSETA